MSPPPKVAIIGAGPAGLTLARLLQVHKIPCTIFEKDPTPAHRATNGGCLDLHPGSGQDAIKGAGLWDDFQEYARYDGQAYIISDETGHQYLNIKGLELARPEIDRPHLRNMLLDSVEKGSVHWGFKLERVDPDGTLHFAQPQGRVERGFGLIVGADGAWSEMWIDGPETACPDVSATTGDGSHWAFGRDGRVISLQRQSDRSIQLYTFMHKPESWHAGSGIDATDREAVKAAMLAEFAHWAPHFKRAIEAVNGNVIPRSHYMLPVGTHWQHRRGFTLIGDAAHLMTPFAGEGVNSAMHDALTLARHIIAHPDDMDGAAEEYEREMFPRAKVSQQVTWDSLQVRFDEDGNEKLAEGFREMANQLQSGSYINDGSKPDAVFTTH